ncbi:MAG: ATP-binding protein [Oligoflexales bacterium]
MFKIWDRISNTGVNRAMSSSLKKRLRVSNQISFTIALITVPYVKIFYDAGLGFLSFYVIPIAFSYLLVIFLNHSNYNSLSRALLMLIPNISVAIYSMILGKDAGLHQFYFANMAIPCVVFGGRHKLPFIASCLLPLSLYAYQILFGFSSEPWLYLDAATSQIIFLSVSIATFATIFATMYYLYQANASVEEKLLKTIEVLESEIGTRKHSESELSEKEAQLRSIVDSAEDAIFLSDNKHKYIMVNNGAEKFGFAPELVIGKDAIELTGPEQGKEYIAFQEEVMATQTPMQVEKIFTKPDGEKIWHSLILSPVIEKGKGVVGVAGIARNIENEKKIESDLIEAKEKAEAANVAKSSFLAMMSHEIKTPVNIIIGYTDLLTNDLEDNLRQEVLRNISRNGHHLLQLLNGILDLNTIESGKIETRPLPIFLRTEIDGVIGQLSTLASKKSLSLTIDYSRSLPEMIEIDPLRLRQILVNLITNAIKFTQNGEIKVKVKKEFSDLTDKSLLVIEVQDTGIGIDPNNWPKLFQPFSQIKDHIIQDSGGTGLGLFLSKKIAKLIGGDLQLKDSIIDQGSCFQFSWEIAKSCKGKLIAETRPISASPRLIDIKALLVEDNPDIQLLFTTFLKSEGCQVSTANNGIEALEKASKETLHIILMDIQIPMIDGYSVAKKIISLGIKTPIIALTAHCLKGERDKCIAAGCIDIFSKPISKNQLVEAVLKWTKNN